jgi:hypothetical protein
MMPICGPFHLKAGIGFHGQCPPSPLGPLLLYFINYNFIMRIFQHIYLNKTICIFPDLSGLIVLKNIYIDFQLIIQIFKKFDRTNWVECFILE